MVEAVRREPPLLSGLPPPRYVDFGPVLLAGLTEHYRDGDMAGVPNQWLRFAPWLGHIPAQRRDVAYGVVCNADDDGTVDYLTAAEVSDYADLPDELARLRLPARRYAVWTHGGHITEIGAIWRTIWSEWVPTSALRLCDAPFFEFYPEAFDPETGRGGFEIWMPVEA